MDTRRFRNRSQSQALARMRWLGWVMLMMFVLVQMATGAESDGRFCKISRPEAAGHSPPAPLCEPGSAHSA
jgi:hypothetical protein